MLFTNQYQPPLHERAAWSNGYMRYPSYVALQASGGHVPGRNPNGAGGRLLPEHETSFITEANDFDMPVSPEVLRANLEAAYPELPRRLGAVAALEITEPTIEVVAA